MRPDSLPRLWRYINLLLTYLLTYYNDDRPALNVVSLHDSDAFGHAFTV